MKDNGGVKSGLSYRKPLGQKQLRGETNEKSQRPHEAPRPKKG